MDDSDAFYLPNSRKVSWFDNHRKFLDLDHRYRYQSTWFLKNTTVSRTADRVKSGSELLAELDELGLMKVTELHSDEVNRQIISDCGCGWKKRSIFWDLPYWSTNLVRHNLDVMHIEKNFFDNVFNTVMNVEGKTKDNAKSREDVKMFCRRPQLGRTADGKYPQAVYVLD